MSTYFSLRADIEAAGIIRSLWYGADERGILTSARNIWPDADDVYIRRNFDIPKAVALVTGTNLPYNLLFLTGVERDGGVRLVVGWDEADRRPQFQGFNSQIGIDARAVISWIGSIETSGGKPLYCWGHSGGGGVAESIATTLNTRVPTSVRGVVTYGCPMVAANSDYQRTGPLFFRRRWMSRGDIVTQLPYTNLFNSLFSLNRLGLQSLVAGVWHHPSQGLLLSRNRGPIYEWVTLPNVPVTTLDIADWITRAEDDETHPHSINVYRELLITQQSYDVSAFFDRPAPTTGDPTSPVPRVRLEMAIRASSQTDNTFINVTDRTYGPDLNPPDPSTTNPDQRQAMTTTVAKDLRATITQSGNTYVIYWMGVPVASTSSPSKAKKLAANINGFVRRLRVAGTVDSIGFGSAQSEFFRLATMPGGGYNPPLNEFPF